MKVKLSELYDIGSSKRVFQSEWREEGVPFYRAREIAKLSTDGYVDNELFIDEELYVEYIGKYGKPEIGDVMVTGVGTLGVCYVVKPNDKFYFKDGNILWFRQKAPDKILSEYLVKAFDSKDVKEFIEKNSSGTTVGTFTIQTAKKMELSLPTIEEQKNIICKISKIENIIKQRKRELSLLDNLIKARFVELFGEPLDLLDSGKTIPLDKAFSRITVGFVGEAASSYTEVGIPYLRTQNVRKGYIDFSGLIYVSEEFHNTNQKSKIKPGDIVVSRVGVNRGMAAVIPQELEEANIANCLIISKEDSVNSTYLAYYLNMSYGLSPKFGASVGSAQGVINTAILKKWEVFLPPFAQQEQFAAFVEQTDKSKVAVQKALNETQLLFDSLMQKYFG